MPKYQACFINHANSVIAAENFDAADDPAAIAYARTMYRSGVGRGYELWQDDRHFHSASYADAALSDEQKLEATLPLGFTLPRAPISNTPSLFQRLSRLAGRRL
jgi:hypothetical protein